MDIVKRRPSAIKMRLRALQDLFETHEILEAQPPSSTQKLVKAKGGWLRSDMAPAYLDVKLSHDICVRYRAAFKQAIRDMQAWKRQTDQLLEQSILAPNARRAPSDRQLALYLFLDGQFMEQRLFALRNILYTARAEAQWLDTLYRASLQEASLRAWQ